VALLFLLPIPKESMPDISQVHNATTPIKIQRGSVEFQIDAYLERISVTNDTYRPLVEAEGDLKREVVKLKSICAATGDTSYFALIINAKVGQGKRQRGPTPAEIEKRTKEFSEQVEALLGQLRAAEKALAANQAERIAHLTAKWDLTDEGEPWPVTVENLLTFSPDLLEGILEAVERGVFGPLATRPRSGS